jgi:hypothetical protein
MRRRRQCAAPPAASVERGVANRRHVAIFSMSAPTIGLDAASGQARRELQ